MEQQPVFSIVVALGRDGAHNRAIGKDNQLLWHISDDLKRFKQLTMGHPLIMGRKTFESIGRPLPGRENIVITRDTNWDHERVRVMHSLDEAVELAKALDSEEIFFGGGTQIYEQALPLVSKLYLTLIDDEKSADTFFPPYEDQFTRETFREERETSEGLKYTWIDLERA